MFSCPARDQSPSYHRWKDPDYRTRQKRNVHHSKRSERSDISATHATDMGKQPVIFVFRGNDKLLYVFIDKAASKQTQGDANNSKVAAENKYSIHTPTH